MKRVEAPSYPISIFIAGSALGAAQCCREYCDKLGFCVTVTKTRYVYTNGESSGLVIGLINYPRFPATPAELWAHAEHLGAILRRRLNQESYSIQSPDRTVWISFHDEDTQ